MTIIFVYQTVQSYLWQLGENQLYKDDQLFLIKVYCSIYLIRNKRTNATLDVITIWTLRGWPNFLENALGKCIKKFLEHFCFAFNIWFCNAWTLTKEKSYTLLEMCSFDNVSCGWYQLCAILLLRLASSVTGVWVGFMQIDTCPARLKSCYY